MFWNPWAQGSTIGLDESFQVNDGIGQFSPLCVSELPGTRIYPEVHIRPMQSYVSVQDLLCTPSLQQGLPVLPSVGKPLDNISVS